MFTHKKPLITRIEKIGLVGAMTLFLIGGIASDATAKPAVIEPAAAVVTAAPTVKIMPTPNKKKTAKSVLKTFEYTRENQKMAVKIWVDPASTPKTALADKCRSLGATPPKTDWSNFEKFLAAEVKNGMDVEWAVEFYWDAETPKKGYFSSEWLCNAKKPTDGRAPTNISGYGPLTSNN